MIEQRLFWINDRVNLNIPSDGILLKGTIKEIDNNFARIKFLGDDEYTVNINLLTVEKAEWT